VPETPTPVAAPHSQEYLTQEGRAFYWRPDYLRLLAERWGLGRVRAALEVGCGLGHWSFALAQVLPPDCRFTGLDREDRWVAQAAAAAAERGLGERFRFLQGKAERLPFPSMSFDLVTCQTVLMHLPQPALALIEMMRVLRPGGLLVAVEPANRSMLPLCGSLDLTPDQLADRLRFYLTCERGKKASGEGDNSVGDRLPGMVAALGLQELRVYQWEHAAPLYPPYLEPLQQAEVADCRSAAERGVWVWDRETARRYFAAGGGEAARFDEGWGAALAVEAAVLQGIDEGTFHSGGGGVMYVVSGRKP
jgi:SAM-dependent methyltransferase